MPQLDLVSFLNTSGMLFICFLLNLYLLSVLPIHLLFTNFKVIVRKIKNNYVKLNTFLRLKKIGYKALYRWKRREKLRKFVK
jgi:hypothetical protein